MMAYLRRLARRLHNDTSGAMSIEKILIIALISLPIIILLWTFKTKVIGWFDTKANELKP